MVTFQKETNKKKRYDIWLEHVNRIAKEKGITEAQLIGVLWDLYNIKENLLGWAETEDFMIYYKRGYFPSTPC